VRYLFLAATGPGTLHRQVEVYSNEFLCCTGFFTEPSIVPDMLNQGYKLHVRQCKADCKNVASQQAYLGNQRQQGESSSPGTGLATFIILPVQGDHVNGGCNILSKTVSCPGSLP